MKEVKALQDLFSKGKISRRTFMGQMAMLGIGATVAGSILNSTAMAQEPVYGGHFVMGGSGGSSTDSLDPTTYASFVPATLGLTFANRLVETLPDGSVQGDLAESFEGTDGGKRWIFKLHQGVEFHNGKEMTSADVVYSINRHRGDDSTSGAAGQNGGITDVKATGKYEVEIHLEDGNADLPFLISDYHMIIQPEGSTDDGIGTGPFVMEDFEHGVRYMTSKNPNYHKSGGPYVDSFELRVINDLTARMVALQTLQVHAIERVDPKLVDRLQRAKNVSLQNTSGRGHYVFVAHLDTNPYDNSDVMLALKYALNRDQMVEQVLRGYGTAGNDHPINTAYPNFENAVEQRAFDLDKAAFHYKKSGHSGPIVLKTSEAAFSGAVDAAILFQESAAQAGIDLQVVREPADGYWSDVWNVQPFCASYWGGRPTQDLMFSVAYKSDAAWNDTRFQRDDFDTLLLEARSELDDKVRASKYSMMQEMLSNEGGVIVPMFNDFLDAISTYVKGYEKDPAGALMYGRVAEYTWLDFS